MHTIGEKKIRMLKPRDIKRCTDSVRSEIDQEELHLLSDSISASGVLQPLLVRRIKRGTYQLISGERRLQAALKSGLRRVPCIVHNVNDQTAFIYALAENLQTKQLSFFDEARGLDFLINKKKIPVSQVAASLGVAQTTVFYKLQLLRLDEKIRRRIMDADLTEDHAKALLRLPKEARAEVLDSIISQSFSPKQTEDYIFSILNPPLKPEEKPQPREKNVKKSAIGDPRLFSNSLTKLVDTLKQSGVKVNFKKSETDTYTEYKIRIKKGTAPSQEPLQLTLTGS